VNNKKRKITFTKKAEQQLDDIQQYLTNEYSPKKANQFLDSFQERLEQVKQNPHMFKATPKSDKIRKGHLNKLTSFFYKIYSSTIRVLLIKDNRTNNTKFD
jgi:plasmid stabilization system protein ParE